MKHIQDGKNTEHCKEKMLMGFKCGLDPFLKAQDPQCSIKAPAFMFKNRREINAALFDRHVLTPGSTKWCRRAMKLGAALNRQERQMLNFHRKTALKICRKYHEIIMEYPDLQALRANYGLSAIDCNFMQFIEILKNTAQIFGVKISISKPNSTSVKDMEKNNSQEYAPHFP